VAKPWRINWVNGLLLPVVVALVLVGVGLLQGYLHWWAGFDREGRSIKPPVPVARRWVGPAEMLQAMVADLDKAPAADRPHYRYLTLAHRHNDNRCPAEEVEADRKAVRAAVAGLALPERSPALPAVDANGVVLRLDLRDLGWLADPSWRQILVQNPYGLTYEASAEIPVKDVQEKLQTATGERVPHVRADWLVVGLSRPPLGPKAPPGETVRKLLERYAEQTLDLEAAAEDLGMTSSEGLRSKLAKEAYLREEFGLAPLQEGKTVRRSWWETDENLVSPYQELSRVLGLGKPFRPR